MNEQLKYFPYKGDYGAVSEPFSFTGHLRRRVEDNIMSAVQAINFVQEGLRFIEILDDFEDAKQGAVHILDGAMLTLRAAAVVAQGQQDELEKGFDDAYRRGQIAGEERMVNFAVKTRPTVKEEDLRAAVTQELQRQRQEEQEKPADGDQ